MPDTGCGKTTVVQFLSLVFRRKLHAVNCHATTETSDLLGGLRPVRGRDALQRLMCDKLREAFRLWPHQHLLSQLDLPKTVSAQEHQNAEHANGVGLFDNLDKEMPSVEVMVSMATKLATCRPTSVNEDETNESQEDHVAKRRKLETGRQWYKVTWHQFVPRARSQC